MRFKAIIFDLDGTLLDTLKDLALSVNTVLKKHGLKEHPVDAYRYFVGDGIEALVQRAFAQEAVENGEFEARVEAVKEEYGKRWADHTVPYSGVPEMLDYLEERQIHKAIFSNKLHEFAVLTVTKLLPDWSFSSIIGIKPGIPRKPDPHGALLIAEKIGVEPDRTVYLGDTATDMQTAVAGGFYPVGALWGFRPAEELLESGAGMLAHSPLEVTELFD